MAKNTLPEHRSIAVAAKRCGPLLLAVAGLVAWFALQRSDARATPPPPAPTPQTSAAPNATTASTQLAALARIEFTTAPPVHATVTWGNTRLGRITPQAPLVVERPRDSGPLDVIVRAQGFLPVHTRAHTFADNKLQVKLTRLDQKSTLLGYRAPLDAGTPPAPDDIAPPSLWDAPGTGDGSL